MNTERLKAYLKLHLAEGVGAVLFGRLAEQFGSVSAAVAAGPGGWRKVKGVGDKTVTAISAVADGQIDDELALATQHDVEILCLEDDSYPVALKNIHNPPPVLYVRGQLRQTDAVALGLVGSRRCTHYGQEQAQRFAELLGRAGFTVVSGGARGIDTAAHRGSLVAGGRTIAVMGCGLCETYPSENADLFSRIVSDGAGAVVSELPMRTAVLSGNFPTRNRIISGLSLGVLVVEAARRSGSLITAREAAEEGRVVFAVPGRVDSPMSRGSNELIRDGVILVQNLDDILEHLDRIGGEMAVAEDSRPAPSGLTPDEQKLYNALAEKSLALDELVRLTGLDSGKATSTMTMLTLKGAVVQKPGNIFARRSAGG